MKRLEVRLTAEPGRERVARESGVGAKSARQVDMAIAECLARLR